jgi:DNA adenine methylase Dam
MKRSPFFYVGDKAKLMSQIILNFPKNINNYYEPFVGGGSSFLSIKKANNFFLNDIDSNLITLHQNFQKTSLEVFLSKTQYLEDKFGLSASYRKNIIPQELKTQFPKTYFAQFNKGPYNDLKDFFNNNLQNPDLTALYLLLIYGFNRMIRFNKNYKFNVPVGNVDFNRNVLDSIKNYYAFTNKNNIIFFNQSFENFLNQFIYHRDDFIYLDPPYLISKSEYNKNWSESNERTLLNTLDSLNSKNVKFAISNLIRHKGEENTIFINWSKKYKTVNIKSNYISYHDNTKKKDSIEILVLNYE